MFDQIAMDEYRYNSGREDAEDEARREEMQAERGEYERELAQRCSVFVDAVDRIDWTTPAGLGLLAALRNRDAAEIGQAMLARIDALAAEIVTDTIEGNANDGEWGRMLEWWS